MNYPDHIGGVGWPGGLVFTSSARQAASIFFFGGYILVDTHTLWSSDLWEYDIINEQFKWRGNRSMGGGAIGYPMLSNATWPAARTFSSLVSSINLLWLYGGYGNHTFFSDLSSFSDGILSLFFQSIFCITDIAVLQILHCALLWGYMFLSTIQKRVCYHLVCGRFPSI